MTKAAPPPAALARSAVRALLAELAVTPKPGLVDLRGRGAHDDLCVARMSESALTLEATFAALARAARGERPSIALREELGALGRTGEREMLRATGGVNTHRGALFALGLLVAAASMTGDRVADGRERHRGILARAGAVARLPDRFGARGASHGAGVLRAFGVAGALGEATAGFPHLRDLALPLLARGEASADVLLALVAHLGDTCLLHRGGSAGLAVAQNGARAVRRAGGTRTTVGRRGLERLSAELSARRLSPGGSADLLAAALFVRGC